MNNKVIDFATLCIGVFLLTSCMMISVTPHTSNQSVARTPAPQRAFTPLHEGMTADEVADDLAPLMSEGGTDFARFGLNIAANNGGESSITINGTNYLFQFDKDGKLKTWDLR